MPKRKLSDSENYDVFGNPSAPMLDKNRSVRTPDERMSSSQNLSDFTGADSKRSSKSLMKEVLDGQKTTMKKKYDKIGASNPPNGAAKNLNISPSSKRWKELSDRDQKIFDIMNK